MAFIGFLWILLGSSRFLLDSLGLVLDSNGFYWIPVGFLLDSSRFPMDFYWIPLDSYGFYWILMNFY